MSLAIQGEGSSLQPVKRRRGRPCRDSLLKHAEAAFASPGSSRSKRFLPLRSDGNFGTKSMLGQSVTGYIEATFDAGYLLSVRIGESNARLRGLVFKPGHYIPITAANDVAPHLPMTHRSDIGFSSGNLAFFQGQDLGTPMSPPPKRKYTSRKEGAAVSASASSAPQPGEGGTSMVQSPGNPTGLQPQTQRETAILPAVPTTTDEMPQVTSADAKLEDKETLVTVTEATESLVFPVQDSRRTEEESFFTERIAGRMTELLQAVEENMTASLPVSMPKFNLRELPATTRFEAEDGGEHGR